MQDESEFRNYVAELLAPVGPISFRRMFGSVGIFCSRGMFGLIVDDTLYLKVTTESRGDYEAAGMTQLTYERGDGQEIALPYFQTPVELLDEPERLLEWVEQACAAAVPARRPRAGKGQPIRRSGRKPRA